MLHCLNSNQDDLTCFIASIQRLTKLCQPSTPHERNQMITFKRNESRTFNFPFAASFSCDDASCLHLQPTPFQPYNGRAKPNRINEYDEESSQGANEGAIINYGYSSDETISSLASSGNFRITITIQVCEGEFHTTVSKSIDIFEIPGYIPVPRGYNPRFRDKCQNLFFHVASY